MSMRKIAASALAGGLGFLLLPAGWAQLMTALRTGQDLNVQVGMETSGEATLNIWSRDGGADLDPLLPEIIRCPSGIKPEWTGPNTVRCEQGLQRDGLALVAALNLAPAEREIAGSKGPDGITGLSLYVNHPRLGFASTSLPMTEGGNGFRVNWTRRFEPDAVPKTITIRFGYLPEQLFGIYLPLLALAIALTLIATFMSRAGYAPLAQSAILLGTMIWMATAAQLNAEAPLRILLFGSPLTSLAALFVNLWPPLICAALGVRLGSAMRGGNLRSRTFGAVLSTYAIIPLILTSVLGALPNLTGENYVAAAVWLATLPLFLVFRRVWNRVRARTGTRLITAGELKDRVSALAARAGCPQTKIYVVLSARAQAANAFALPGKAIFLNAPLIRLLNKREVDAVAAHELSHAELSNRAAWGALMIAMLLCETPGRELVNLLPGGLAVAMMAPIAMVFFSLYGSRKREFAADANAAGLTGDPRAMMSSLAKIARHNDTPLASAAIAEWFSSHPSTLKRIRALAAVGRLQPADVEAVCAANDADETYEIPAAETSSSPNLFTPAWLATNAGINGWLVLFVSSGSGLLVAWLLERHTGFGMLPILVGIVLACALTKAAAATGMAQRYGRLGRKLAVKLGVDGQLVGLAPDGAACSYNGYRFTDVGLLHFENGRLFYQSEHIAIALNPADVVEVGMVAASPANWFRKQPMVQFRDPDSDKVHGLILHTVDWFATQGRLLRSIERWRAGESSAERTSIKGLEPVASETFQRPTIARVARGFVAIGIVTQLAAMVTAGMFRLDWLYETWALVFTACAYGFMLLPSLLYRAPVRSGEMARVETE